ncbi:MAG: rhomboid family intramembrane serine protease [Pseudomonadales bacterium]|nr:rhomboid family intramembrane serine protease [Pseudomonadales bacterium]
MQIWKDSSRFPKANGEWQILDSGTLLSPGENDVRKLAARWFLTQKKLISSPDSDRFLPAICTPGISEFVHESFLKRFRIFFYIFWFYFLVTALIALNSDNARNFLPILAFLGLGLAYFYTELRIAFIPYKNIAERALFYNWILNQSNQQLGYSFRILMVFGVAQWLYLKFLGDLDSLIISFGTYFPPIQQGELWRYLAGPWIHSSFMHWLVNAIFLLYIVKLIGMLANKLLLVLFLFSIPCTAIAVHLLSALGSNPLDAFVGISGGVYFLFGWLTAISFRNKHFFPAHFSTSIMMVAVFNLILPELLSYNSSFAAHLSGFLLGLGAGYFGLASNLQQWTATKAH